MYTAKYWEETDPQVNYGWVFPRKYTFSLIMFQKRQQFSKTLTFDFSKFMFQNGPNPKANLVLAF